VWNRGVLGAQLGPILWKRDCVVSGAYLFRVQSLLFFFFSLLPTFSPPLCSAAMILGGVPCIEGWRRALRKGRLAGAPHRRKPGENETLGGDTTLDQIGSGKVRILLEGRQEFGGPRVLRPALPSSANCSLPYGLVPSPSPGPCARA